MAKKKSSRKSRTEPVSFTYGKWKFSQSLTTFIAAGVALYFLVFLFVDKG